MHRSFEPGWIGGRLCLAVALIAMIASCSPSSAPNSNAGPPVTIKVWDWNAGESYYKQGFDNFNKQHSNIKVEYTFQQSSTFSTVVQSAFQSGAAPDIFMSYFAPMADLMSKGWVQPIGNATDSDVAAWMKTFPADSFKSNIHVFDGKVYSFPYLPQGTIYLYYNKTVLQAAGVSEPPKTWSELRADAKKVTQSSGGKSYGLVTGGKDNWPWFMNVSYLAATAGVCTDGVLGAPPIAFDYSKGQYHPNNPATAAAIQLWLDMKRDGTTMPGIDSLTDADAHAAFGNGKAAFFFSGNWTPSVLSQVAPSADFGVAPVPVPDSGRKGYMLLDPAGRTWVISSKTKSRGAAFEVIKYMTSLPFQQGYVKSGAGFSVFPAANTDQTITSKGMFDVYQVTVTTTKPAPVLPPVVRQVTPKFSDPAYTQVLQGIWDGKLNATQGLADLENRMNTALADGIAAAKQAGSAVTPADFVASVGSNCGGV